MAPLPNGMELLGTSLYAEVIGEGAEDVGFEFGGRQMECGEIEVLDHFRRFSFPVVCPITFLFGPAFDAHADGKYSWCRSMAWESAERV